LKELDRTPSRECIKLGVLYVAPGQEGQRSILKNDQGSELYEQFVEELGVSVRISFNLLKHTCNIGQVDLATHRGFMGGLDPYGSTGTTAPYYATSSLEVIFHIITRMPTKPDDEQQIHKVDDTS